jgi:hypothetical protein
MFRTLETFFVNQIFCLGLVCQEYPRGRRRHAARLPRQANRLGGQPPGLAA